MINIFSQAKEKIPVWYGVGKKWNIEMFHCCFSFLEITFTHVGKKCSMIIFHHVWNRLIKKKKKYQEGHLFYTLRKITVSLFFFDSVSHLLKKIQIFFSAVKQSEKNPNRVNRRKTLFHAWRSFFSPRMFFLKRVIEKRKFSVFSPNEKKIFSLCFINYNFFFTL